MRAGHAFSDQPGNDRPESPDPMGQEFRALFAEQNLGAPIEVAMAKLAARPPAGRAPVHFLGGAAAADRR